MILYSRADAVVSFADIEELAKTSGSGATLIEVGSDHRLKYGIETLLHGH